MIGVTGETTFIITNSRFDNCRAKGGFNYRRVIDRGGSRAAGGAVSIFFGLSGLDRALVSNTSFSNNVASTLSFGDVHGGAISILLSSPQREYDHSITIQSTNFTGNVAQSGKAHGGALSYAVSGISARSTAQFALLNCIFDSNQAMGGYVDPQNLEDSATLPISDAIAAGGAVFALQSSLVEKIYVSFCELRNNSAVINPWHSMPFGINILVPGTAYGGAISCAQDRLIVEDSTLRDNFVTCTKGTEPCAGGAIYGHDVVLLRAKLLRNSVRAAVPPFPVSESEIYVIGTTLSTSVACGGAIRMSQGVRMTQSEASGNSVRGNLAGGGVFCSVGSFHSLRRVQIVLTVIDPLVDLVTGLEALTPPFLTLLESTFDSNTVESTAGNAKGGVFYESSASPRAIGRISISRSSMRNNTVRATETGSASFGGALYAPISASTLLLGLFKNNSADFGGAIAVSKLTGISNSQFAAIYDSNSARIGGGALFLDLNSNRDIMRPPDNLLGSQTLDEDFPLLYFNKTQIMELCNGNQTLGNRAGTFGDFCALTADRIEVNEPPPQFIWPGKLFTVSVKLLDLLGDTVAAPAAQVRISAVLAGIVHNAGAEHGKHTNSNQEIEITHAGTIVVNTLGEYKFEDLRLRVSPGSRITLTVEMSSTQSSSFALYPAYVNSANHTFISNVSFVLQVTGCPPGFIQKEISGGVIDCLRCPPYTYSLAGNSSLCLPCGAREHSLASEEQEERSEESPFDCLVPRMSSKPNHDIWIIPKGFYPVPAFNSSDAILSCPNIKACLTYGCSNRADASNPSLVEWRLDCGCFNETTEAIDRNCNRCATGYTDRLCSRCQCDESSLDKCWFAYNSEEFVCRRCIAPSMQALAIFGASILITLIGLLLFKHSAAAVFMAETQIAMLLLVLGLGEWWFFDVVAFSSLLFLISRRLTKCVTKRKKKDDLTHEESAYFVGIVKVSLFFFQTISVIIPHGTWPQWIGKLAEALNNSSLRIAGIECFAPQIFSIPSAKFAAILSAPVFVRCFLIPPDVFLTPRRRF